MKTPSKKAIAEATQIAAERKIAVLVGWSWFQSLRSAPSIFVVSGSIRKIKKELHDRADAIIVEPDGETYSIY